MATNLRLRPDAEEALRAEADRSGRSQQELLREALDHYLDLVPKQPAPRNHDSLIAAGVALAPRTPYRRVAPTMSTPTDTSSLDLLERTDRI